MSKNLTTRVSALESGLEALLTSTTANQKSLDAILARLEAPAAKATTTKAKATKAPKAAKVETVATVTDLPTKALTRKTLGDFRKDNPWAVGMSVFAATQALLNGEQEVAGHWRIATARLAKASGVSVADFVAQRDGVKPAKGKNQKAKATEVLAEQVTEAPAKVVRTRTEAVEARLAAPRNAAGQLTPKAQWPLRSALIEAGNTPAQVDKKVAKAVRKGLI